MIYTMLYAENDKHVVSLDTHGNRYRVCLWNKQLHQTEYSSMHDAYEEAEIVFRALVQKYKCGKTLQPMLELPANID